MHFCPGSHTLAMSRRSDYYYSDEQQTLADADEVVVDVVTTRIGIFGWRKYLVYALLLGLTCLAIINIGLIVYMWRVLSLTSSGAGPVRFDSSTIRVEGSAQFLQGIAASNITAFNGSALSFSSTVGVALGVMNGTKSASISLVQNNVTIDAAEIALTYLGVKAFSLTKDAATLTVPAITVNSATGLTVQGDVQTSHILNEHDHSTGLIIESVGQDLTLAASGAVNIGSTGDALAMSSLLDLTISTGAAGAVIISSPSIQITALADPSSSSQQVCACNDGTLYTVPATQLCNSISC